MSGFWVLQVLENIQDAVEWGTDSSLLLPSAYYGAVTSNDIVYGFYDDIAKMAIFQSTSTYSQASAMAWTRIQSTPQSAILERLLKRN